MTREETLDDVRLRIGLDGVDRYAWLRDRRTALREAAIRAYEHLEANGPTPDERLSSVPRRVLTLGQWRVVRGVIREEFPEQGLPVHAAGGMDVDAEAAREAGLVEYDDRAEQYAPTDTLFETLIELSNESWDRSPHGSSIGEIIDMAAGIYAGLATEGPHPVAYARDAHPTISTGRNVRLTAYAYERVSEDLLPALPGYSRSDEFLLAVEPIDEGVGEPAGEEESEEVLA